MPYADARKPKGFSPCPPSSTYCPVGNVEYRLLQLRFGISAISLSSCLVPSVLEGVEQLFLFLPIDHPGYLSYLSLEHTIRTFERGRKEQHLFLNLRRQLNELHDLTQSRPAHMPCLRQSPTVSNCSLVN